MNKNLIKYNITPRVVQADTMQKITISGCDRSSVFYDDITYYVQIAAVDDWNFEKGTDFHLENDLPEIECHSKNGVLSFECFFKGEQEWYIRIFRKENEKHINPLYEIYGKYWASLLNAPFQGFSFSIYSLYSDLYNKYPYKGDLHIHSTYSDGSESPEMVAADYRKFGFDFISITDHHIMQASIDAIDKFKSINTKFKIFPGEEVHSSYIGYFHIVNFNSKSSVNDIILKNHEQVEKEVEDIAKEIALPDGIDKLEIAWRKWINDAIHKAGGITIFPHPYWMVGNAYHTRTKMCKMIFDMGLCDAFEVLGGVDYRNNKNQVALYYQMRAEGIDLPIVGSSDSHSSLVSGDSGFNTAWTVVYSDKEDNIPQAILDGMTAVVDNNSPDKKNVYGQMRLVKYTWFLIENYYETHDMMCNAIGQALLRFVFGDKSQNELVALLENELDKFNKSFFGK